MTAKPDTTQECRNRLAISEKFKLDSLDYVYFLKPLPVGFELWRDNELVPDHLVFMAPDGLHVISYASSAAKYQSIIQVAYYYDIEMLFTIGSPPITNTSGPVQSNFDFTKSAYNHYSIPIHQNQAAKYREVLEKCRSKFGAFTWTEEKSENDFINFIAVNPGALFAPCYVTLGREIQKQFGGKPFGLLYQPLIKVK